MFAAVIELSQLDGTNGFKFTGTPGVSLNGWNMSSAGNLNGDGFDDVVVSSHLAGFNGNSSGSVYVLSGKASAFPAMLAAGDLNGVNGLRIDGPDVGAAFGLSSDRLGDLEGDGFDDIIVGSTGDYSPSAYVIKGGGALGSVLNLASPGGEVTRLTANDWSQTGFSDSAAGDLNGDGVDDLVVGASRLNAGSSLIGGAYGL